MKTEIRAAAGIGIAAALVSAGALTFVLRDRPIAHVNDGAPIQVTSQALAKEWKTDNRSAVLRYRGRTVDVTGTVQRITVDFIGNIFVHLDGYRPYAEVSLPYFRSSAAQPLPPRGSVLTMRCKVAGSENRRPRLQGCKARP